MKLMPGVEPVSGQPGFPLDPARVGPCAGRGLAGCV